MPFRPDDALLHIEPSPVAANLGRASFPLNQEASGRRVRAVAEDRVLKLLDRSVANREDSISDALDDGVREGRGGVAASVVVERREGTADPEGIEICRRGVERQEEGKGIDLRSATEEDKAHEEAQATRCGSDRCEGRRRLTESELVPCRVRADGHSHGTVAYHVVLQSSIVSFVILDVLRGKGEGRTSVVQFPVPAGLSSQTEWKGSVGKAAFARSEAEESMERSKRNGGILRDGGDGQGKRKGSYEPGPLCSERASPSNNGCRER
jgi:hypothetical protein